MVYTVHVKRDGNCSGGGHVPMMSGKYVQRESPDRAQICTISGKDITKLQPDMQFQPYIIRATVQN